MKLSRFLEINEPSLSDDQVFVDDYSRPAYATVGFGKFTDSDPDRVKAAVSKLRSPDMGGPVGWFKYLANAAFLSLTPPYSTASGSKEKKTALDVSGMLPEGVLQLGGTLVVRGDEILYRYADAVPGDTPDLNEVVQILKKAVAGSSTPRGPIPAK
jgi:hypothetical protein